MCPQTGFREGATFDVGTYGNGIESCVFVFDAGFYGREIGFDEDCDAFRLGYQGQCCNTPAAPCSLCPPMYTLQPGGALLDAQIESCADADAFMRANESCEVPKEWLLACCGVDDSWTPDWVM
jgi:hypothetical protein